MRATQAVDLEVLERIQRRVLWLSTWMVHHANVVRPNPDNVKVGGHQASSTSAASLLTALYFGALRESDVVAVKAHAAPAFYAIQYLRGRLDADALRSLRVLDGLQAYPSRRKNPGIVDLATGSMGLGAVSALFGALAARYASDRDPHARPPDRFIAMVGDAELDEGNVWEALGEEPVSRLGNVLWIVDVNRQSLDRVVPDDRPRRLADAFRAAGWAVLELRWGRRAAALFARRGGDRLRARLESLSHRAYQRLLRLPPGEVRKALVGGTGAVDHALDRVLADVDDATLAAVVADVGGHDLAAILDAYGTASRETSRPVVILASTIKGWRLPFAGDPMNHGMVTTAAQIDALRADLGVTTGQEWARFPDDSPEAAWIRALPPLWSPPPRRPVPEIPEAFDDAYGDTISTQEAFGRVLGALARTTAGDAIVTVSADVAATTHLAGWINRTGVWFPEERSDPFGDLPQALAWRESPAGRHIELGIAEHDLFLLLGALGLSAELSGVTLLPIGTLYDPFVARGLDALHHALYAGGRFVVVATPSGVTLSAEGGAHQSVVTPALGVAVPELRYYEPAFAREAEWILLHALRGIAARDGESVYLRLSTRPVDQALAPVGLDGWREATLAGGYRLVDARRRPDWRADRAISIFAMGALVPEAVAAAQTLERLDVHASVFVVTSPDLLFRDLRAPRPRLHRLVGADEEDVPIVSVLDGHSSALAFLGGALGVTQTALGVDGFGQSGARADLYRRYGIDVDAIVAAARVLLADG